MAQLRAPLTLPLIVLFASALLLASRAPGQVVIEAGGAELSVEGISVATPGGMDGFEGIALRERHRLEPLTAEEIERYNARLGLETPQVAFAGELFASYLARLGEVNAEEQAMHMAFSERLRKGRNEEGGFSREEMHAAMEAMETTRRGLASKRNALTMELFEDYKLVLTPEQLEQWPAVERMRRRDRELAPGIFPGEDIDLIALCEELELVFDPEQVSEGGQAMLGEVLGRYELEIDRLLRSGRRSRRPIPWRRRWRRVRPV